jgi:REP element-mobilizing transposase RayT
LRGHLFGARERTLVRREQFPSCEWSSIRPGFAVFGRVSHFFWRRLLAVPCRLVEYLLSCFGSQLGELRPMVLLKELALDIRLCESVGGMANTYTQIYIQVVFAVQGRQSLVRPERKEELQKYMTGIVSRQGQKLIAIHCMPDHTHVLIGLRPNIALSDLVGDIQTGSTNHINEQRWVPGRFSWQEGFGAFSYSHSQLKGVIDYIRDQVRHHARKTFREEYLTFLKKYEVPHDERYIFRPVDEE